MFISEIVNVSFKLIFSLGYMSIYQKKFIQEELNNIKNKYPFYCLKSLFSKFEGINFFTRYFSSFNFDIHKSLFCTVYFFNDIKR